MELALGIAVKDKGWYTAPDLRSLPLVLKTKAGVRLQKSLLCFFSGLVPCQCVCLSVHLCLHMRLCEDIWVSLCVAPWVLPCACVISVCIYISECIRPHICTEHMTVGGGLCLRVYVCQSL